MLVGLRNCNHEQPMRIAYMLTSLGIGGAERQVVALAELMRERGHAVTIVVLMPPAAEQWTTPVEVVHLNLRKSVVSAAASWVRAAQVLRKFQPDILLLPQLSRKHLWARACAGSARRARGLDHPQRV